MTRHKSTVAEFLTKNEEWVSFPNNAMIYAWRKNIVIYSLKVMR